MAETKGLAPVYPNDVFGRTFADFLRWPVFPLIGLAREFPMRLEEFADGAHLVIRAELPGVDPDKDVQITLDEGLLTISGERRSETRADEKGRHFTEMQYGSFTRTIPLPDGASDKDVTASYRDGILEIRVPLMEPVAPKPANRIAIKH